MRRLIPLFALFASAAGAAPFIQSDPYPTTAAQPDTCKAVEGTRTYESPVAKNTADGSVWCKIDLAGLPSGTHSMQVTAVSTLWGASSAVPFQFASGAPGVPASLKLAP